MCVRWGRVKVIFGGWGWVEIFYGKWECVEVYFGSVGFGEHFLWVAKNA